MDSVGFPGRQRRRAVSPCRAGFAVQEGLAIPFQGASAEEVNAEPSQEPWSSLPLGQHPSTFANKPVQLGELEQPEHSGKGCVRQAVTWTALT